MAQPGALSSVSYTETETEDKAACLVRRYPFNGGYFYYAGILDGTYVI